MPEVARWWLQDYRWPFTEGFRARRLNERCGAMSCKPDHHLQTARLFSRLFRRCTAARSDRSGSARPASDDLRRLSRPRLVPFTYGFADGDRLMRTGSVFQFKKSAFPLHQSALQPSACSECRKINSGWGIPSTRAIAGAKLQSDLLIAIGIRSGVSVTEFGCAGAGGAAVA